MIVVIDNYDSFTYNLVQLIGSLGHPLEVLRNDRFEPADLHALQPSHVVISPGPGRPEQAGHSVAVIREFHGKAPILGVCLGHQSIAVAAGGEVVRAQTLMHGKPSMVHHSGTGLFEGVSAPFEAARYHSLVVDEASLPDDVEVQARTQDGTLMALRWGTAPTFGVQFHPESILTDEGKRVLHNFLGMNS